MNSKARLSREGMDARRRDGLVGPDIVLLDSTLSYKPSEKGKAVAWHQDGCCWSTERLATCSVCEDYAIKQPAGEEDESLARDGVLEPGRVSLHDVYTVHGANHERSGKRRADCAVRYKPATALYTRHDDLPATACAREVARHMNSPARSIRLVLGTNQVRHDFQTGHGVSSA